MSIERKLEQIEASDMEDFLDDCQAKADELNINLENSLSNLKDHEIQVHHSPTKVIKSKESICKLDGFSTFV